MVTLKQLEKENARLKKMGMKLREAENLNKERRRLLKENKKLAREIKFGKATGIGKNVSSAVKSVGKKAGKEIFKGGKIAFKGLKAYGEYLNEQERKQRSLNRTLRSAKKSKRRK
jgi:hypothetical protein